MAFHRGRARAAPPGRPARSGIKTRGGQYKKFDSQRTRDVEPESEDGKPPTKHVEIESEFEDESDEEPTTTNAYTALLASLKSQIDTADRRPSKRRKLSAAEDVVLQTNTAREPDEDPQDDEAFSREQDQLGTNVHHEAEVESVASGSEDDSTLNRGADPFETHFHRRDEDLAELLQNCQNNQLKAETQKRPSKISITEFLPEESRTLTRKGVNTVEDLHLKQRLQSNAGQLDNMLDHDLSPYLFNYVDILHGSRTHNNAAHLRQLISLHAINHILKGRDRILKNNARLAQAGDDNILELRDQGFTRPKVLILTETRQMCAKYGETIVQHFKPEQQENSRRFNEAFSAPPVRRDMPEDYQELFEGNNDNNFITTIKFTRKTIKFYSAFYQSDVIFASPLGLQRIIESEDKRKQDHDFLSSIELVIVDQADASQMQNFENLELVFKHLNQQPKELRDCDVNRVRNFYLDGNAAHFRQTVVLSAYLTPELNRLFNSTMKNIAGKVKITRQYPGALEAATGMGIKQTFSRFSPKSPADDPDARFKFFTTSVLPLLLRLHRPSSGGQGTLIFIPSYYDFLRVRNFFATSTMTENISFGAIHDYSTVSDQRRARSHFLSGKHSILLYTQRAHHFFRLRLRGVRNVVMYGLPDNEIFYQELVADFLASSIAQQLVDAAECTARSIFSKYDALKMERIVGTSRVKNMLGGIGDTFDFV